MSAKSPAPSPMLQQYRDLKNQYPDTILFFRLGDFYEMFFEDALKAAPLLEVQLTSRDKSSPNPVPMCGVPYHAASAYLQKLVSRGHKVAICEQFEEPVIGKPGKSVIRREVVRVVTPALVGDPELVDENSRNLLLSLCPVGELTWDLAFVDLLGGTVELAVALSQEAAADLILQKSAKEWLVPRSALSLPWLLRLRQEIGQVLVSEREDYFSQGEDASVAITAAKRYLRETQVGDSASFLGEATVIGGENYLKLDATTLSSLEILRSQGLQGDGPSLFSVLDRTQTSMGRRLLKDWLQRPLHDRPSIEARLGAVQSLVEDPVFLNSVREDLKGLRDLERLTTKTALGLAGPRDLVAIGKIQKQIPHFQKSLAKPKAKLLAAMAGRLNPLASLTELLDSALEEDSPSLLREGGFIRETYDPTVKELRELSRGAKETIAALEKRERERTGISSLKVKFNKVFGYSIEVTSTHLKKVPSDYIRRQTIANGERYITEELKEFEKKVLTAEEKLKSIEERIFYELRAKVAENAKALLENARVLAEWDCLYSFAQVSREKSFVRPVLQEGTGLKIEGGRHPVVEALMTSGEFVPNDIDFSESRRTWLLTGPNMAGKSTIMRQVALIVILAQAGCFVPAIRAEIGLVDAIFTRIGASDDLARGRSTFMVEMMEVARILDESTNGSLILIDEIGRGTSTYDGLSLAWSLLEHLHQDIKARLLFATHFHELTTLGESLPGLYNANVLVEKNPEGIVFLHRLVAGVCNRSYGIEVAELSGLPTKVLSRAREILGVLESQSQRGSRARSAALKTGTNQMGFFDDSTRPENRTGLEI